jgi:hypothetical protein
MVDGTIRALRCNVCAIEGFSVQTKRCSLGQFLPTIPLGAATLLFALLALRDKVHFLAIGLGNSLSDNTFIKAANELFYGFAFSTFNSHSAAGSTVPGINKESLPGVGRRPIPLVLP